MRKLKIYKKIGKVKLAKKNKFEKIADFILKNYKELLYSSTLIAISSTILLNSLLLNSKLKKAGYINDIQKFKQIASIEPAQIADILKSIDFQTNIDENIKELLKSHVQDFYEDNPTFDFSILKYNIDTFQGIEWIDTQQMIDKTNNPYTQACFNALEHTIYIKEDKINWSNYLLHEFSHMFNIVAYYEAGVPYYYKPTSDIGSALLEGWTSSVSDKQSYPVGRLYVSLLHDILPNWEKFMESENIDFLAQELSKIKGTYDDAMKYIRLIDYKSFKNNNPNVAEIESNLLSSILVPYEKKSIQKGILGFEKQEPIKKKSIYKKTEEILELELVNKTLQYYFESVRKKVHEDESAFKILNEKMLTEMGNYYDTVGDDSYYGISVQDRSFKETLQKLIATEMEYFEKQLLCTYHFENKNDFSITHLKNRDSNVTSLDKLIHSKTYYEFDKKLTKKRK